MDRKSITIDDLNLSTRSRNALYRAGVRTLDDLINKSGDDLERIRSIGSKSLKEIERKIDDYKNGRLILSGAFSDKNEDWSLHSELKKEAIHKLKEEKIKIDVLENATLKTYKVLNNCGYEYLYQIASMTVEELMGIPGIQEKEALELIAMINSYIRENKKTLFSFSKQAAIISTTEIITDRKYKESIYEYTCKNDVNINLMDLSTRAAGVLKKCDYEKLSEIILFNDEDFNNIKSLGKKSIKDIKDAIYDYIEKNKEDIIAIHEGKGGSIWSKKKVYKEILSLYEKEGFKGFTYYELKDNSSYQGLIMEKNFKNTLDSFVEEGKLYLKENKYYCTYISFKEYLENYDGIDERSKILIQKKIEGASLEELGKMYDFTRTNSQRIIARGIHKVNISYYSETGKKYFMEDRFRYFYENYDVTRVDFMEMFDIDDTVYNYLVMNYVRNNSKQIPQALADQHLNDDIKEYVMSFLRKDMVLINGIYHEKKFWNIIEYAVKIFAKDDIQLDEFIDKYNNLLKENGVNEESNLYIEKKNHPSCINQLMDSRYLLWKPFHRFRYYNVDLKDYDELIKGLHLSEYENIELSTLKLFNAYPKLMGKYDIKDHYELHNLLRKIIPKGSFNDFSCRRMPTIRFGEFDKVKAFIELLISNSPITTDDLISLIHTKFGYDKGTISASYLAPLRKYCCDGIYSICEEDLKELKK